MFKEKGPAEYGTCDGTAQLFMVRRRGPCPMPRAQATSFYVVDTALFQRSSRHFPGNSGEKRGGGGRVHAAQANRQLAINQTYQTRDGTRVMIGGGQPP